MYDACIYMTLEFDPDACIYDAEFFRFGRKDERTDEQGDSRSWMKNL